MLKIVVLGYGELAQSIVLGILQTKHKLIGVMRWKKDYPNRLTAFIRDVFVPDTLLSMIRANNIKEIKTVKANSIQFMKEIKKLKPDVIIVASWGEILKKEIIDLPKVAFINCHPSLLPRHRGSNPYVSVLRQGETKTGITFHLMNEKIDAGDILIQEEVVILPDDTGETLKKKCAFKAKEAVKILLERLERGELIPIKQKESEASYFPVITPQNAVINWHESADYIHNQIRGLYPWLKCYTLYENNFLFINSSKIIELEERAGMPGTILEKTRKGLLISTGDPQRAIFAQNIEVYGFLSKIWSKDFIEKNIEPGMCFKNI
ncbi:MAG TPA: methionyl-tRNA formyltransferase [Candidatus Gastranaerophilales bacterium]|nr:methionyl-tRNA formyltransferase [Candidatus Gastranaerophilales bacterium]